MAGELSTTREARLHAHIAEAFEELYGDAAGSHAAELAHHFNEAQTVLAPKKLVHYSLLAGEQALSAFAFEEALPHFERGLVSKGIPLTGAAPAPDNEAAALLFGFGRAQAATLDSSQVEEAVANLGRAFDYYEQVGDAERAVAIAEHPVGAFSAQRSGMAQLMRRALELVPPESHEAARILAFHGGSGGHGRR